MDMKRKQSEKKRQLMKSKSKTGNREAYLEWKKNKLKHECLKLLRKERKQTEKESKQTVIMETGDSESEEEPRKKTTRKEKETKSIDNEHSDNAKSHIFSKAQKTFQEEKERKEREKEEHDKKMAEQRKAMKKYKNKKKKRQLMINKKTHKGQPIMKYQMNALLDKIKAQVETS